MPRVPMLAHFPEYVRIGRELADLHLRYEKPVSAEELGVIVEMRKEDYTVVDKIHLCPVPLRVGKAFQRNGAGSEQELFQKRTIETLLYGHAGCEPPALYRKCSG